MSRNKYYYVIWDKKRNEPYLDCGRLPIFYTSFLCKELMKDYCIGSFAIIKKVEVKKLLNLINPKNQT